MRLTKIPVFRILWGVLSLEVYDRPRDSFDSFTSCTWTDTILLAVLRVQHLLHVFMSETCIRNYIK